MLNVAITRSKKAECMLISSIAPEISPGQLKESRLSSTSGDFNFWCKSKSKTIAGGMESSAQVMNL